MATSKAKAEMQSEDTGADAPQEARAEVAYRYLRNAIFANELPAGFQAAENEIAAQLGMSRTPVHEAMARLQDEGFVQILPRKGILVRALSPADLLEIYDVLIAIEGAAAERLAEGSDEARSSTLDVLQASTDAMASALRASDLETWRIADERFHDALVEGCGNGRIKRMAATVSGQSHRARRLTLHLRPLPTASTAEHQAIIDAIQSGDAAAAGNAARAHRRHARGQLVPILKRINVHQL
ncbi:GntR family transcriptional regulator [Chelatococcus asaccharovorans]|uniref:GntR family transcriptional regulator n=1 Tax=Chelatococcus asaccharovorans TaxID=28210 RepID=UPI00224C7398|nr:GntR family transcriptional regulator [Chelatococcus asaccharovorans]CAH1668623.1 GntR family transcriptional regulator [Chelatococcus asaccharovorans]CAH1679926.1 GntR family transcriptional regulator [Chelatococcus asaccharovorans]